MGAAAQKKATNRDIRRAFGSEACATIESLHAAQVQMAAGLTELERKERILDKRTRELRADVNVQAETLALFMKMTLRERLAWVVWGTVRTPTPVSRLDSDV